jgi:hypothetical protein
MGLGQSVGRIMCAVVIGSWLVMGAEKCAADQAASTSNDAQAVAAAPEFAKTLWTVDAFGSFADRFAGTPLYIPGGTVGFDTYIYDNIGVGAEISGLYAPQPAPATGVEAAFNVRGHFLTGDGWTLYGETSLGVAYFGNDTPPGGSHFNFTVGSGGGCTLRLTQKIDLMLGARFFHISNAGTAGAHHNPSFNGVQGYAGLMFKL